MSRLFRILVVCVVLAPLTAAAQRDASGERRMLREINALRSQNQLAPLERDPGLDTAARVHSVDMAEHQELDHVSARTGTPADRVVAAEVEAARVAQNIARQPSTRSALASILQSAPHRAQLLDAEFTHVGLAAIRGEGGVYVTQIMARIEPEPELDALPPPAEMDVPRPPQADAPIQPPAALESNQAPAAPAAGARPGAAAPDPTPTAQPPVVVPAIRMPVSRRPVAGYWMQQNGRWWYFPVTPGAQPGTVLRADPRVQGPPPGHPPATPTAAGRPARPPAANAPRTVVRDPRAPTPPARGWQQSPRRNGGSQIYWY